MATPWLLSLHVTVSMTLKSWFQISEGENVGSNLDQLWQGIGLGTNPSVVGLDNDISLGKAH